MVLKGQWRTLKRVRYSRNKLRRWSDWEASHHSSHWWVVANQVLGITVNDSDDTYLRVYFLIS
jgi:hypothetical protein